jgi:hypothetical protein
MNSVSKLVSALFAAHALGCGTPVDLDQSGIQDLTSRVSPQSFAHGFAHAAARVRYFIAGHAGDDLQPEVWPTNLGDNPLHPTLQLFGPPDASGSRPLLASGHAGDTAGHVAIDHELSQTGLYLVEVGAEAKHEGSFTFRLWSSASHSPRVEALQVSLLLLPSDALEAALSAHDVGGSGASLAWANAELDLLAALVRADTDPRVAISDLAVLYATMEVAHLHGLATGAIVERAQRLAAEFVGTPAQFAALPASAQTLALQWLGAVQPVVFKSSVVVAPTPAEATGFAAIQVRIRSLVASWSGAVEVPAARKIIAFTRGSALYGFQASWQAVQLDTDNETGIFSWSSIESFSPGGAWLGESSDGALQPDD